MIGILQGDSLFGLRYDDRLTVYLWFESLIGYYSLYPKINPSKTEYVHFFGKNIIYYHGIIWPILLNNLLDQQKTFLDLSVRGFMSSLSNIEFNMEELCQKYGTDAVRYYLTYKVKDNINDFTLNETEINTIVNTNLVRKAINFNNRVHKLLIQNKANYEQTDDDFISIIYNKYIDRICNDYKNKKNHSALLKIIDYSVFGSKYLSNKKDYTETFLSNLSFISVSMTLLLSPIIPDTARKMMIFYWNEEYKINNIKKIMNSTLKNEIYYFK